MKKICISSSSLITSTNNYWSTFNEKYELNFSSYGDWSGALLNTDSDVINVLIIFSSDLDINQNEYQNNIIKSMIENSIENKNQDDNLLELVKLQNELNSLILQIESLFNNYGITNILPDNKIEQIKSQINSIKNNLSDVNNIKQHKDKLYELKSKINSIFN